MYLEADLKQAHIYISFAAVLMAAACQTPQDRCAERQAPIVLKDGSVIHGDPIIAGDCVVHLEQSARAATMV